MFDKTKNEGGKNEVEQTENGVIHKLFTNATQAIRLCLPDNRLMPRRQLTNASKTIDYCPTDTQLRIYKNIRIFLRKGKKNYFNI